MFVRIILACQIVVASALPSAANTIKVVTQTPASITLECAGILGCSETPQDAANKAQAHCRQYGRNAQQTYLAKAASGNLRATYNCVP